MTERILDFSERPARLNVRDGLLGIHVGERSALPREGKALPYDKMGRDPENGDLCREKTQARGRPAHAAGPFLRFWRGLSPRIIVISGGM